MLPSVSCFSVFTHTYVLYSEMGSERRRRTKKQTDWNHHSHRNGDAPKTLRSMQPLAHAALCKWRYKIYAFSVGWNFLALSVSAAAASWVREFCARLWLVWKAVTLLSKPSRSGRRVKSALSNNSESIGCNPSGSNGCHKPTQKSFEWHQTKPGFPYATLFSASTTTTHTHTQAGVSETASINRIYRARYVWFGFLFVFFPASDVFPQCQCSASGGSLCVCMFDCLCSVQGTAICNICNSCNIAAQCTLFERFWNHTFPGHKTVW